MLSPVVATPLVPPEQPGSPSGPPTAGAEHKGAAAASVAGRHDRLANAAVCGVINAVVALPVMASFAAIIFRVSRVGCGVYSVFSKGGTISCYGIPQCCGVPAATGT